MPKQQVVCFKVDAATAAAMQGIPNRSDFLRSAVLSALRNTCPVCRGTGRLSPRQMAHWRDFAKSHAFERCDGCHEYHWVCPDNPGGCPPDVLVAPLSTASGGRRRRRTPARPANPEAVVTDA